MSFMAQPKIPNDMLPWIEARKRFRLSHAQIQMARELGLNPKQFGKLDNHHQEPWKQPLPEFIASLYKSASARGCRRSSDRSRRSPPRNRRRSRNARRSGPLPARRLRGLPRPCRPIDVPDVWNRLIGRFGLTRSMCKRADE